MGSNRHFMDEVEEPKKRKAKRKKLRNTNHNSRGRRWSKIGRDIRNLFDPNLPLQIHCVAYAFSGSEAWTSTRLPRYWITLGKEIIFDYPKHFLDCIVFEPSEWEKEHFGDEAGTLRHYYTYGGEYYVPEITELIREYIKRPKEALMDPFENDHWGLTDILRAADRRIGKRRLLEMKTENPSVMKIISLRLNQNNSKEEQSENR